MSIGTVKQLCTPSAVVTSDSLVEQVAQLDVLQSPSAEAAREFFRRNHFTSGLNTLVSRAFRRLAGESEDGAFYLTQAMGGGKTHSLVALGYLASDPALRREITPHAPGVGGFGAAKVVLFSGHQTPERFLWGHIADSLGRSEAMARFWKDGASVPGVDEWVQTLGDQPVLLLLDELPSYLQMAQGRAVGSTTLADLTIGALERLFNALPKCPRACIVVTNLQDDIYLKGSGQLKTLIESLRKHADRNAQAITPVQQNSSEIYEIVRKRLFDALPPPDRIQAIAQAYVKALEQAKRIDTIPSTPESFIQRIQESYPFHPSIRDIVGRFQENPGYQKTRALIRLLRLAVRGARKAEADGDLVFLVGLQHLDFSDQQTLQEIAKINDGFSNAISRDVSDNGEALAEKIDAIAGDRAASQVARILLMSSLSSSSTPLLGLTDGELIEALMTPVSEVSAIKDALTKLQGRAWYLFQGVDQRAFFGKTANVTAEITDVAQNIPSEVVDDALRKKLAEVFKPVTNALYGPDMAILPALDEIRLSEDRPTLIILEKPADKLPEDLKRWWEEHDMQNRVLVLTADPNAMSTLKDGARRAVAIDKVGQRLRASQGEGSQQLKEWEGVRSREDQNFLSALRETFKTIVFPIKGKLREVTDFRMEFQNNDYQGEKQILDALAQRGKYVTADKLDAEGENLRLEAEDILFDADAVQPGTLRRNAAARAAWFWLQRGGLDDLIKRAVQRGHWREENGLVLKRWERVTRVTARTDDFEQNAFETGEFTITVTPQDGDIIYVSEDGPPDPAKARRLDGRTYKTAAPAAWFLAVDSKGAARTGEPAEWRAPLRVRPEVTRTSEGYRIRCAVTPRAAVVRATFDGSDPKAAEPLSGDEVVRPSGDVKLRCVAELGGRFSEEASAPLGFEDAGAQAKARPVLDPDRAAILDARTDTKDTGTVFSFLSYLAKWPDVRLLGGSLEIVGRRGEQDFLALRFGADCPLGAAAVEAWAKALTDLLADDVQTVTLRLTRVAFPSGREMKAFVDFAGLDFDRVTWTQEE